MKPGLTFIFFLITALAHSQQASKHCCELDKSKTHSLEELGKEYQRLKKEDSYCCDNFGSGLYSVMHILEDSLRTHSISETKLIQLIGSPDEEIKESRGRYHLRKGEKLLLYHWRGRHDYLILEIHKGILQDVGWYYALD
jgi:hypothetical protein